MRLANTLVLLPSFRVPQDACFLDKSVQLGRLNGLALLLIPLFLNMGLPTQMSLHSAGIPHIAQGLELLAHSVSVTSKLQLPS